MATSTGQRKGTRSRKTGAVARAQAATAAEAESAGGSEVEAVTSFPPASCDAGLPASDVLHEIVYGEFKQLNRTVDELPYPLVLLPRAADDTKIAEAISKAPNVYATHASAMTALDAQGGVPVSRAFHRDLRDLKRPLVAELPVRNITPLLNNRRVTLNYAGGTARAELNDQNVADLVAGLPTTVLAKTAKGDVALKLVQPAAQRDVAPLQNLYEVASADSFIRDPYVAGTDGTRIRVDLNGRQLRALASEGHTTVRLGGHEVTLRSGGEQTASQSYAASVTSYRSPGLESTSTRNVPSADAETPVPVVTQLKLALYVPWRQGWKLRGYSRGELLHALALAPQEEVTIEVSSWDRRKRSFEDSAQSEFEQTTDFTDTEKDSQSVVREVANQSQFGVNFGTQVGAKFEVVSFSGSAGGDARTAINNSTKTSFDTLREATRHASMKLRLQRQTKIGETTEIGTEEKVTRKVRNPNLCHTLLLNYYEVLTHYDIVTEFNRDDACLCVLIPIRSRLGAERFTYQTVRYYESVLRRVLLVPSLADGFEAARKLFAQDQLCEARRRSEACNAAKNPGSFQTSDQERLQKQANRIVKAYATLKGANQFLSALVGPPWWQAFVPYPVLTLYLLDKAQFQRWLYVKRARELEPNLFTVLDALTENNEEGLNNLLEALGTVSDLGALSTQKMAQDQNVLYQVIRRAYLVPPPVIFTDIPGDAYAVSDGGLYATVNGMLDLLSAIAEEAAAKKAKEEMAANQATVQKDWSDKEIAEALEAVDALTEHLNDYRNFYRTAIFKLMPWSDEFEDLLRLYSPLIQRQVLGFVGDSIALPINADLDPRTKELFDELITRNPTLLSMQSVQEVTLPATGVHLENRLGGCSGCEDYIEQIRASDIASKQVDVELKRQTLEQQRLETDRFKKRLDAKDFTDPLTRPTTLRIEQVKEDSPAQPVAPTTPTP